jgi:tRNA(His) 5'-end guanylyltransferase
MKGYEAAARQVLPRRMPIIMRVDGRAFHTFTRDAERPFDLNVLNCMVATAKALCSDVQGAQLAYLQSDEISILIHGYKRFASQAWFDNEVQKMCSVGASVATEAFNTAWRRAKDHRAAHFDARVFILPESDVCNYFIWRQQDASRNSIQMLARSLYSHKECHLKNGSQLQEMCFQRGHNWNDLPTMWKRGCCVKRVVTRVSPMDGSVERTAWDPDFNIPVFTSDRSYVEQHLVLEPETS